MPSSDAITAQQGKHRVLDHVCHPIARLFIKLLQVGVFLSFYAKLFHPDTPGVLLHDIILFATASSWVILWSICIWELDSLAVRFCLGTSSGLLFLLTTAYALMIVVVGVFFMPRDFMFNPLGFIVTTTLTLVIGILLLGFGSMLWVSIRPPSIFKTSDPHSHENHPLPQSC